MRFGFPVRFDFPVDVWLYLGNCCFCWPVMSSVFQQVKAFSNTSFVTSSVDSGLSLWKDDGMRLRNIRGKRKLLPNSCHATKVFCGRIFEG